VSAYLGFDCVFMIWFSCFVVCLCIFVFWFSRCCWFSFLFCRNSTSFPVFPHIISSEQRNSKATPLQIGSQEYQINHHPNAKNTANNLQSLLDAKGLWQPGQSFILAGFILSLPRPGHCGSEQPIHRERQVATQHPSAQLCWSSSSSFPHSCTTTSWNWTVTKLI